MAKDDWFRLKSWSNEDKSNFFKRLNRSRSAFHKAQYLRIQASYLTKKYPESAIELCNIILNDYPELIELSITHYTKAESYIQLGKHNEAIQSFRNSIEVMRQFPNSRNYSFLHFGYWAIITNKADLYDEILALTFEFQENILFPKDYYFLYGIRSIINHYKKNIEQSKIESQKALEYASKLDSGLKYHPTIGLVEENEKEKIFYKTLENISRV